MLERQRCKSNAKLACLLAMDELTSVTCTVLMTQDVTQDKTLLEKSSLFWLVLT